MREFHDLILSDWDVNLLDIIYAHESDPTDVFATIERIHSGRETALKSFGGTDLPPRFQYHVKLSRVRFPSRRRQ